MKRVSIIVLLLATSCSVIDQKTLAAWTTSDLSLMQDLETYRKSGNKPSDDVVAHEKKPFASVTSEEENMLMTELLADVNADPAKSSDRKTSYGNRIHAHLDLFNSLKGK